MKDKKETRNHRRWPANVLILGIPVNVGNSSAYLRSRYTRAIRIHGTSRRLIDQSVTSREKIRSGRWRKTLSLSALLLHHPHHLHLVVAEEAEAEEEEGDGNTIMLDLQEVVVVGIITVPDMAVEEDTTAVAAEAIVAAAAGAVDAVVADRTTTTTIIEATITIETPAATAQVTLLQMPP